jgi:hypothetical protein
LIIFSISRLISSVQALDKKNISAGNLLFQPSKIMKSMSSPGHVSHGIEPLESRIAPAVILVGNPNTTLDIEYSDAPFVNIGTGNDLISQAVRGAATVENAYYLYLSAGDTLKVFNSTAGPEDYLVVTSGNVVAFFIDGFGTGVANNEVEEGELVSISMGKNAAFDLRSGLAGDVLTNLDERGTASRSDDTIDMDG